ncbi:MAG: hypothetical protein WD426_20600 [Anditalea sp.]
MKGLLIGVGFLLFSSSLFGFEETQGNGWIAREVQLESLQEKLNEVSFPSDSPVVIPVYDIAFGDQNKPNQEKKVKGFSHCGQGINSLDYHNPLNRGEWEKRPTFKFYVLYFFVI